MDPREKQIREQNPDWTDEQVKAELVRLGPPPDPPPAPQPPPTQDPERDRAFAEMRRRAEAAERDAAELRSQQEEAERKKAEEEGRYKELAEQEKARADALQATIDEGSRTAKLKELAAAVDFKPEYVDVAIALLPANVDRSNEEAVRKALETVAEQKPDLVKGDPPPAPPSGLPPGSPPGAPPTKVTREQLESMTPRQIADLDPKVLNEALAAT
jgi:hypothetical protein